MDILSTRLSPNERSANFSISDTVSHTRHSASKSKSEVSNGNHSNKEDVGRFRKYTSKVETKNKLCEIFGSDAQTTENTRDLLQVPTLDDTIESLLVMKCGHKAAFDNSHSLNYRQMRAVDKIRYQGQTVARIGIMTTRC